MDGTQDELFNNEDEENFDRFADTEIQDAEEANANMQTEIQLESDVSDVDSEHEQDFDCDPGSPGH